MALLLAAALSPSSSILRLAPRRWSRKLLAPLSNQRPIDSNTPGFCCAGAGGGAASCAQAHGASIRPATRHVAAIRRCRLSIMVQILVQGLRMAIGPKMPESDGEITTQRPSPQN